MLDSKFLITLIGLAVAIFAICNFNTAGAVKTKEGFPGMGPSLQAKRIREVQNPQTGTMYTMLNQYGPLPGLGNSSMEGYKDPPSMGGGCGAGKQKGEMYQTGGTYQSMLSPRMSGMVDYGANIRYNMPSRENMAVPCNPLGLSKMAREDYTENYGCSGCGNCGSGGCGSVGCKAGGMAPDNVKGYVGALGGEPGFTSGDYAQVAAGLGYSKYGPKFGAQASDSLSMLPVGDMTTLSADGEVQTPVVYDRFIYANRNSFLRGRGDPIRGDLPIVPCTGEWFRPSVHPQIDLQEGALNVMGGFDNATNNALTQLMYQSSGDTDTTLGGVSLNQINQTAGANVFQSFQGGPASDVLTTAFP